MISIKNVTRCNVQVVDSDSKYHAINFYSGSCELDAEEVEAFLEMVESIVEEVVKGTSVENDVVLMTRVVRVLQDNGHAPDSLE